MLGRLLLREFRLAGCRRVIIEERSAHWLYSDRWGLLEITHRYRSVNRIVKQRPKGQRCKGTGSNPWIYRENEDKESDWVLLHLQILVPL